MSTFSFCFAFARELSSFCSARQEALSDRLRPPSASTTDIDQSLMMVVFALRYATHAPPAPHGSDERQKNNRAEEDDRDDVGVEIERSAVLSSSFSRLQTSVLSL